MSNPYSPSLFVRYLVKAVSRHRYAYTFIRKHKVWGGFMQYNWAVKAGVLLAGVLSLRILKDFTDQFSGVFGGMNSASIITQTSSVISSFVKANQSIVADGSIKYIMMILLEILIFHCSVKTVNILNGQNKIPTFKDFVNAEKRMIKVAIRCFILETIAVFVVPKIFNLIGIGFISPVLVVSIQCYFLGYMFMDNYLEQYNLNIKESGKIILSYSGLSVGLGLVTYVLFMIPFVGAILAPILGAVTAAILMYELNIPQEGVRLLHHEFVESKLFKSQESA